MIVNDIVSWREKRVLAIAHMAAVLEAGDRANTTETARRNLGQYWPHQRHYVDRAQLLFEEAEARGDRE